MLALCILLFAIGYLVRDGWPATGRTNLGSRPLGAVLCGLGTWCVAPWWVALVITATELLSFYTDQKHGEGQQATSLKDAGTLAVSGVTSLAPVAFLGAYFNPYYALALFAGLIKPLIWFSAWWIRPDRLWSWLEPTRVSAIIFGVLTGTIIGVINVGCY
jgi:hypothetical protein